MFLKKKWRGINMKKLLIAVIALIMGLIAMPSRVSAIVMGIKKFLLKNLV